MPTAESLCGELVRVARDVAVLGSRAAPLSAAPGPQDNVLLLPAHVEKPCDESVSVRRPKCARSQRKDATRYFWCFHMDKLVETEKVTPVVLKFCMLAPVFRIHRICMVPMFLGLLNSHSDP